MSGAISFQRSRGRLVAQSPRHLETATSGRSREPGGGLADIVAKDLRILLVAINPSLSSELAAQHFATPRNPFWRLLYASGLTHRQLLPREAADLLSMGLGLTSLVDRATRTAAELARKELRDGAAKLQRKVDQYRPRAVALLGLTLFPYVFPGVEEPGPGLKTVSLSGAAVFVVPNPSGRNRAYPGFSAKLRWYSELANTFGRGRGAALPESGARVDDEGTRSPRRP
jgi:TDG/mug DNA glycosylase family protein